MIIPVGSQFMTQYLVLVTKDADEKVTARQILPVSFVPLTGAH
jgi:protein-L-isoaspartate(D-aspartate) O-methyltransferase